MDLARQLVACGAVRFGSFTLTSGRVSDHYVDVKAASTSPDVLRSVASHMADIAETHGPFDHVAGMELGAIPLATAVALETGIPMLMLRKKAREHGTGTRIEGAPSTGLEGRRVLVVEDVTTTAGSTIDAVRLLRGAGAVVEHATVVVDREAGGVEALEAEGVALHPLVRVSQVLELAKGAAA